MEAHMQNAAQPDTGDNRLSKNCSMLCIAASFNCILLACVILFATPIILNIYNQFDIDLPTATLFIVNSKAVLSGAIFVIAIVLVSKEFVYGKRLDLILTINTVTLILTSSAYPIYLVFMLLPIPLPGSSVM
jgi:hypothetical protein